MSADPRSIIGVTLSGEVLEIGPGHVPFPVGACARVRYVDRSVEGGRDANWPELIGAPHGPKADYNLNIDVDGLAPIPNSSLDAVIACHVIEHFANPIAALREIERVLRYQGQLVLVVPDRSLSFDASRQPTPLSVVLDKYRRGVRDISHQEIKEFCSAIYYQPPIHPPLVREWHNPSGLSPERYELFRRRSIHVHCWSAEEFASFIVGLLCNELTSFAFKGLYLPGTLENYGEFGMVLERGSLTGTCAAASFTSAWTTVALNTPNCDSKTIARFAAALHRDLAEGDLEEVMAALANLTPQIEQMLKAAETNEQAKVRRTLDHVDEIAGLREALDQEKAANIETHRHINALLTSTSWRLTAPLRAAVRVVRRRHS